MAMEDNIETHPAKKMKLQDKEIPKSQDGAKIVIFEDPQPTAEYYVLVDFKVVSELHSTFEDPELLFGRMMNAIGCSESQISKYGCTSYCFLAQLTPDKAKELSDLDSVREVKPHKSVPYPCRGQIYVRERSSYCKI